MVEPAICQSNIEGGVYPKENNRTRDARPYSHLREADVMWSTRVWRKIDLREKLNYPFFFPIQSIRDCRSLVQVLIESVDEGGLVAYDALDDEFTRILTGAEINQKLRRVDGMWVPGPDPSCDLELVIVPHDFNPANVKEIRLKEE